MSNVRNLKAAPMAGLLVLLLSVTVSAASPQPVMYQGFLSDSLGEPLSGNIQMVFAIYDVPEGGGALWTSGPVSVDVNGGEFRYMLGSQSPLTPECFDGGDRWLGVQIPPDQEMLPRTRLTAVPYAHHADQASMAAAISDDAVTSDKIADGSIQAVDIAQNGADTGQVLRWDGSNWAASDDESGETRSDCGWSDAGDYVYVNWFADNVGIGSFSSSYPPEDRLHVRWCDGNGVTLDPFPGKSPCLTFIRHDSDVPTKSVLTARDGRAFDFEYPYGEHLMSIDLDGNVGIGTTEPLAKTHILRNSISVEDDEVHGDAELIIEDNDASIDLFSLQEGRGAGVISLNMMRDGRLVNKWSIVREAEQGDWYQSGLRFTFGTHAVPLDNETRMHLDRYGNLSLGSLGELVGHAAPRRYHRLSVVSSTSGDGPASDYATAFVENTGDHTALYCRTNSDHTTAIIVQEGSGDILRCGTGELSGTTLRVKGNGETWCKDLSCTNVDVAGETWCRDVSCTKLELRGGTDIAEPFLVSGEVQLPKGALVVIDAENPGQLKLSEQAYDTRVAGIVSGAGGVNPGIILTQEGTFVEGEKVALSGRVYCQADASYGAIRPGDLLTTSPTPGHAMKASDRQRAYGAVIGKAMTRLDDGRGLVLVLVNLQ